MLTLGKVERTNGVVNNQVTRHKIAVMLKLKGIVRSQAKQNRSKGETGNVREDKVLEEEEK